LQGKGIEQTVIEYDDHQATDISATFTAFADDIVISGITFKVYIYIYLYEDMCLDFQRKSK